MPCCYLDGLTSRAVQPPGAKHLDLVPVWTGAPVSVTPTFHSAVEQNGLSLEEEEEERKWHSRNQTTLS